MDISKLSKEERMELLRTLKEEENNEKISRREAFEGIRAKFTCDVKKRFIEYLQHGKDFASWLRGESETYMEILKEYGKLKRGDEQMGFKLNDEDFKMEAKGCRVKGFDDRADIAEKRLVDFLNEWIGVSDNSRKNPMYKLAMRMIQRNEMGDLDYKSISALYALEEDFNSPEYSEIMSLFRESGTIEGTVIRFYFWRKDKYNNWSKVEPSFNRMRHE